MLCLPFVKIRAALKYNLWANEHMIKCENCNLLKNNFYFFINRYLQKPLKVVICRYNRYPLNCFYGTVKK